MQEGSVPSYQDRQPLFPGGSCYPLSGEGGSVKSDERLDQLNVIFGVIGTPDQEDIDSIGTVRSAEKWCQTLALDATLFSHTSYFLNRTGQRVHQDAGRQKGQVI